MKLGSEGELSVDRSRPAVAALVETCPSLALRIAGKAASTESLVDELLRDEAFFRSSGGGVTISGGEPLTQPGLALEVARACIARGISVAIETCLAVGEVGIEAFLRLPLLWLADLKHVDGQRFREGTGGELGPVLANLERLAASGADLTLRVPVVPGFNADDASMAAILAYAASLPRGNIASPRRLDLLPYHELAAGKYRMLGRDYPLPRGLAVPEAELQRWAEEGRSLGLEVSLGG